MLTERIDSLTPREREILVLIGEGYSLAEIAQQLHRSLKTVESHRLSLGKKLRVSNRVELAKIAIAAGLVKVDTGPAGSAPPQVADANTELSWLQAINRAIFNATGPEFLSRFCVAASQLPGVEIAAICMPDPHRPEGKDPYHRYVVAVAERGQPHEPLRYHAINTPCETIIEQGECCFSEGVIAAYPQDQWLKQLNAESYIGVQLQCDCQPQAIGGVGLIGKQPLDEIDKYRSVLTFFAPHIVRALHATVELNALRSEQDQRQTDRVKIDQAVAVALDDGVIKHRSIALAQMIRRLNPLAGPAFLRGIVDALHDVLGFEFAGICALQPPLGDPRLQSVAFHAHGRQADTICYQAKDTPCEVVLRDGALCLTERAAELFPGDVFMAEHKIEGFAGIRLPAPNNEIAGVLWVVDARPLNEPDTTQQVLRHFASRIGAELHNFMRYEALLQERESLKNQLKNKPKLNVSRL